MRPVMAIVYLAFAQGPLAAQGGTGGFTGDVRFAGPLPKSAHVTISVWSNESPGGDTRSSFSDGPLYLPRIPAGKAQVCVRAPGYRTIFDTVTIRKRSIARRKFLLQPDDDHSEPYPDCDRSLPMIRVNAVDSAGRTISDLDTYPMWEAVLRHYRRSVRMSEGDFVRLTFRMTGASSDTVGPAVVVMSLHRDVAPVPSLLEWLDGLEGRGLVEATCRQVDVRKCPQQQVTTFLKLSEPKRLHGDTIYVGTQEIGVNPAACQSKDGTFSGLWLRSFILVPRDGRWEVIGRSTKPTTTASGVCRAADTTEAP